MYLYNENVINVQCAFLAQNWIDTSIHYGRCVIPLCPLELNELLNPEPYYLFQTIIWLCIYCLPNLTGKYVVYENSGRPILTIWRSRFGPWKQASVSQFTFLLIKTTGLIELITSTSVEYELLTAMPSMTIWPTVWGSWFSLGRSVRLGFQWRAHT